MDILTITFPNHVKKPEVIDTFEQLAEAVLVATSDCGNKVREIVLAPYVEKARRNAPTISAELFIMKVSSIESRKKKS